MQPKEETEDPNAKAAADQKFTSVQELGWTERAGEGHY